MIVRTIIEKCDDIDKSPELVAELNRIKRLADSAEEIEDIPRIYAEATQTEFNELPSEIKLCYQEMLSYTELISKASTKN